MQRIALLSLLLGLGLAGCNSGSVTDDNNGDTDPGTGSGAQPDPLSVTETWPAAGKAINIQDSITIQFDQALDEDRLKESHVWLEAPDGTPLYGEIEHDPESNRLSFRPDTALDLRTRYEAVVHADIASRQGATLEDQYRWHFYTRPAQWQESVQLGPVNQWDVLNRDSDTNSNGRMIQVWNERESFFSDTRTLYMRWFDPKDGWSEVETLSPVDGIHLRPYAAIDDQGNALVIWSKDEGDHYLPHYRYYQPESGWSEIQPLTEDSTHRNQYMNLGVLGDGQFAVVYRREKTEIEVDPETGEETETVTDHMVIRRFNAQDGWSDPNTFYTDASGSSYNPAAYFNRQGQISVAWKLLWNEEYSSRAVAVMHFDGTEWSGPARISANPVENESSTENFHMATHADGRVAIVWSQTRTATSESALWFSRREDSGNWSEPVPVAEFSASPKLTMGPEGRMVVTTLVTEGADNVVLKSRRYDPENGWHPITWLMENMDRHRDITTLYDEQGIITLAWSHDLVSTVDSPVHIIVRRFNPDQGWDSGTLHGSPNGFNGRIDLARVGTNDWLMVWQYFSLDEEHPTELHASRLTLP